MAVISKGYSLSVFVTSKSYIYINNEATPPSKGPQISERGNSTEMLLAEPIYENLETVIMPSDDNKFTIYVNYDFLSKSNVRLLEPDIVQITQNGKSLTDQESTCCDESNEKSENNDTLSKTMQSQQISMYIGEFTSNL